MLAKIQKKEMLPDIVVLELAGSLSEERDSREVESRLDAILQKNCRKVVFDMTGLEYMDSLGVGVIVMCSAKLRKTGGELRVAGAWGMVDELCQMTRVKEIVSFYTSLPSATQGFELPE